jgi:hypothetical protein
MTNEEYLKLFNNIDNISLNETQNHEELKSLNSNTHNNWSSINETPNLSDYKIDDNINSGWSNNEFQIESRINGIKQNNNNHYNSPHQHRNKRNRNKLDLNGLNQFIDDDDDLNEVYQQPKISDTPPVINESIEDVDEVSVELFEKMNANAMLTLNHKLFNK